MIDSKYLVFFLESALCVPAGVLIASSYRRVHDAVFVALVLGTTQPGSLFGLPTDINFLSREWYRGSTRGIEVSYLDLLAVILFVSSVVVRRRENVRFFWPPSLGFLIAYLLWCIVNVAMLSEPKLFGVFECTKIARAVLLFTAVNLYIRRPREVRLFVWALITAIGYESSVCLIDRYWYGYHRIEGTFGHPNSLSMYCLQCVPIFIAVFFAEDVKPRMRKASIFAFLGATGCVFLSISRMGVVSLLMISGATFLLCTGIRLTPRNITIAFLGLIAVSLMLAKSWDSLNARMRGTSLRHEYFTQEGDRGSYFHHGMPAIRANPVTGVGLNNWSYWITNRYAAEAGYSTFDNIRITHYEGTEIPPRAPQQSAPAHNYYLLTITELGVPGLFLTLALFARWLWMSGQVFFVRKKDLMTAVRLGALLSLCGILLQSWTEWEFRQTPQFFLCHVIMGVAAVLYVHRPNRYAQ